MEEISQYEREKIREVKKLEEKTEYKQNKVFVITTK